MVNKWDFIAPVVLVVILIIALQPKDTTAGYDRFKTVGVDKIKEGYDITVIADTETGCMYGQTSGSYGTHETFVLAGQPKCGTGGDAE